MSSTPKIVQTPPGPKSKELMELKNKYVPKPVYTVHPVFAISAEGATIKDVDGNTYIDFISGISVINTGHRHPEIIKAISDQLDKYLHLCFHVTPYESYLRVAEKLATLAPGNFAKKVMLANSGAEAVENAVKVARRYEKRPLIITFLDAFHGRTFMSMNLTGHVMPYKYGFNVFDGSIQRVPYAYCYRCSYGLEYPSCNMRCVEYIRELLSHHISPDDVAGIIFEPIQGEGGFIVPPKEFNQGLRKICDENKFLLICDEIQTGMGRTGKMFATEHYNVAPDIITMSKALGGGLPLSAVIGMDKVMDAPQVGGLGGTFGGNPLSCVAALKAIEIVQEIMKDVPKIGELVMRRLKEIRDKYEIIGDVRGIGLMNALEFVENKKTKKPADIKATQVVEECRKSGLILNKAKANVVRTLPPLNIDKSLLNKGLDILENAIKKAA